MPALLLSLLLASPGPVGVRWPAGTLHGFPSLSDEAGKVIADGELTQELRDDTLVVHLQWSFADGRHVREHDQFRTGTDLAQQRFSWVEERGGVELRRFEVDFATGRASAVTRTESGALERDDEHLDLPHGRAFAGYGTALAVAQLGLKEGGESEITFVAFTPKPRAVDLGVRLDRQERLGAAGRTIPCDHFTLHAKLPFPISLFAGARDGQLWFTHEPPPALVRVEQTLIAKDDPPVIVDVIPRGSAHAPGGRRGAPQARQGQ